MKTLNQILTVGLLTLALPAVASAASITEDSLVTPPATMNLNLGTAAFAYYGDNTQVLFALPINANPTTDAGNLGKFTAFTTTGGSSPGVSEETLPIISYTGGSGGANPSTEPGTSRFDFVQNGSATDGFSITSTLFAPTETFNFYIQNFDTTSNIVASLNDGATPFTLNNQVLFNAIGDADGTGAGHTDAVLTLTVTGSIGDILTFSDASNITGVSDTRFADTALNAVTIETIPEPATYAMMSLGALVLLGRLRRTGVQRG